MKKDTGTMYKNLYALDSEELNATSINEASIAKLKRKEIIDKINENGSEEDKRDLTYYLLETGKESIKEDGSYVIAVLERTLQFKNNLYLGPNDNYQFGCFDEPGFSYGKYNAYFKVFNDKSVLSAKKCARITFLNPSYIHHPHDPLGKKEWFLFLNDREMKDIDRILHTYVYGHSVWYWLTYEFYVMSGIDFEYEEKDIPSYRSIKRNVDKGLNKNDNTNVKDSSRNNRRS